MNAFKEVMPKTITGTKEKTKGEKENEQTRSRMSECFER